LNFFKSLFHNFSIFCFSFHLKRFLLTIWDFFINGALQVDNNLFDKLSNIFQIFDIFFAFLIKDFVLFFHVFIFLL